MECSLAQGELMRLSGGERGVVLRCIAGTIWLTTGDGRDYLVRPGESFILKRGISALAEALGGSELRLDSPREVAAAIAPIASRLACRACV